jgi:hypothetical protein
MQYNWEKGFVKKNSVKKGEFFAGAGRKAARHATCRTTRFREL